MNEVERHSVTGYGRQDINYNDPEGEFVYYEDYAALKDSAMEYAYRWGKAQDDIKKAHMLHSMQKEEIASLKEQLTNAQEALKSAGIEADTVQAGVMELVSRMNQVVAENAALKGFGDTLNDMHNNLNGEGTGIQGRAEVACQQVALEAALEEFDAIQTPATDAYLNAVRAEGVEMFANHFNCPDISDDILDFAAQLRVGNDDKSVLMMKAGKLVKASEEESRQVREFMRAAETPVAQLRAGNAGKDGV